MILIIIIVIKMCNHEKSEQERQKSVGIRKKGSKGKQKRVKR
jgi:hypothetical protein